MITQLTMFPDYAPHVPQYRALAPMALGMAATDCDCCGQTAVPTMLGTSTEYAPHDYALRNGGTSAGWRRDSYGTQSFRTVPFYGHDCCESFCGHCESVTDEYCGTCGSCHDCCECYYCESCEEMVTEVDSCGTCESCCERHCVVCSGCDSHVDTQRDYVCGHCEECESCCECVSCDDCGTECSDSYCSECMTCDDCCECEEDCDDCDDCERVAPYVRTLTASGTRTFGIELEIVGIGGKRAAAALTRNGLPTKFRGYTHGGTEAWKTVTDASVSGGCEAVSPILCGADGLAQLESAMLALLGNGADVDSQCGTHVHVGCEDLTTADIAKVVKFYSSHSDIIDALHPRSRRGMSQWSGPATDSECSALDLLAASEATDAAKRDALRTQPRYRSVNVTAFPKYGTLEFRQHAGTLNYRKLSAWLRFLLALIDAATADAASSTTLAGLLAVLGNYGLGTEDSEYLTARAAELRSHARN